MSRRKGLRWNGRELIKTSREVWLRNRHRVQGDRLYLVTGVEHEDGLLFFEGDGEVIEDDRGASA